MEVDSNSDSYPINFYLLGTSFRKLALDEREMLAVLERGEKDLLRELKKTTRANELAMISTCNRFEVLSVFPGENSSDSKANKQKILGFLEKKLGKTLNEDDFYYYDNRRAVEHLLNVASSLDSMVLGEGQILGQVKKSYLKAVDEGCAGKFLHHLFQFSFHIAKKIRSSTSLGEKGVSVSYVAVKLAEQIFGDLSGRSVLVIGSGQMAELAALHFKTHGAAEIVVANRTLEKALELAARIKGSAISLEEIETYLPRVDIVISSISQSERDLISSESLEQMPRDKSLFLLDLGVPRNFSPALAELDDIYLYNIDDLSQIAENNKKLREAAAREARILIDYGLVRFEKWLAKIAREPKILEVRKQILEICRSELSEILKDLPQPRLQAVIDQAGYKISQKIAHQLLSSMQGDSQQLSREAVLSAILENDLLLDKYSQ